LCADIAAWQSADRVDQAAAAAARGVRSLVKSAKRNIHKSWAEKISAARGISDPVTLCNVQQ